MPAPFTRDEIVVLHRGAAWAVNRPARVIDVWPRQLGIEMLDNGDYFVVSTAGVRLAGAAAHPIEAMHNERSRAWQVRQSCERPTMWGQS
jgi:hypothetical protein